MAVSDVKRRAKSSERPDKISVSDKTRNGPTNATDETSIFGSIIDFDVKLTTKTALCSNENAVLGLPETCNDLHGMVVPWTSLDCWLHFGNFYFP